MADPVDVGAGHGCVERGDHGYVRVHFPGGTTVTGCYMSDHDDAEGLALVALYDPTRPNAVDRVMGLGEFDAIYLPRHLLERLGAVDDFVAHALMQPVVAAATYRRAIEVANTLMAALVDAGLDVSDVDAATLELRRLLGAPHP